MKLDVVRRHNTLYIYANVYKYRALVQVWGLAEACFAEPEYLVYQPYVGLHVVYHARRILYRGRSRYQKIDIIENEAYGIMLFLNNNLQHAELDAEIFNRAITRPILARKAKRVLVLGGGSGQTVKTLLKSRRVEAVTVVEIDEEVVEACKRNIPGVREALEDRRTRLVIGDAFEFIRISRESYDGLVVDLTEERLNDIGSFEEVYRFAAERCRGLVSAYIGSTAPQLDGPERIRCHLESAQRYLERCRVRSVFIPSFGSRQAFLYAGVHEGSRGEV
jgi:spermidine synthase